MQENSKKGRQMKILFLMNHIIMGGLEKVLLQYLDSMQKAGVNVTVLSCEKVTDQYFIDFFRTRKIDLEILNKHNAHFFLNKIVSKYMRKRKLRHIIGMHDIVIDFANFTFFEELKNINKKKIGFCHGSILFFNSRIDKRVLDIYDDIVCLSDNFTTEFVKLYPGYRNKIHRIYNPINVDEVRKLSNVKVSVKKPYFVAVQRLDSVDKDVATIINAFNIFSKKHPKYNLYIIGDGPQIAELRQMTTGNKHVIFTGKIDNPYPFIKNAAALILSSTSTIGEGLPNTLLEAHALGTLAISSDAPSGPREILLNGRAGILFEPGNAQDLAVKLGKIANKQYATHKMIECADKNINRFDADKNLHQLLSLIKK